MFNSFYGNNLSVIAIEYVHNMSVMLREKESKSIMDIPHGTPSFSINRECVGVCVCV